VQLGVQIKSLFFGIIIVGMKYYSTFSDKNQGIPIRILCHLQSKLMRGCFLDFFFCGILFDLKNYVKCEEKTILGRECTSI
jgi:hypothetical protein